MPFSECRKFNEDEVRLVKDFLEKLVGQSQDYCRKKAQEHEFIFLDSWNNKMGFIREEKELYLILSLEFKNSQCTYYQVILKEIGKKWSESRTLDYDAVRKLGIVS